MHTGINLEAAQFALVPVFARMKSIAPAVSTIPITKITIQVIVMIVRTIVRVRAQSTVPAAFQELTGGIQETVTAAHLSAFARMKNIVPAVLAIPTTKIMIQVIVMIVRSIVSVRAQSTAQVVS